MGMELARFENEIARARGEKVILVVLEEPSLTPRRGR